MTTGDCVVGRTEVLIELLAAFARIDAAWRAAAGDAVTSGLAAAYRARCATLGAEVVVTLPGDREIRGRVTDVDAEGRLRVRTGDATTDTTVVSAGDVVHVRPPAR